MLLGASPGNIITITCNIYDFAVAKLQQVAKLEQILVRPQASQDFSAIAHPAALSKTAQGVDIAGNFREIPIKLVFSGNYSLAALCCRFA